MKCFPLIAKEKLAEFNDVFCEKGVFTPEQSERILEAGKNYGLIPKIHADEIESYGGAELAAKIGAISAEHLLKASEEGIQDMAKSGTIACLLPATALYLREEAAAGGRMIDEGVAVAISTDCNPGFVTNDFDAPCYEFSMHLDATHPSRSIDGGDIQCCLCH